MKTFISAIGLFLFLTGVASAFDTSQTVTATPIAALPFTINASGNYFLPADLTATTPGASIIINANQVTLDLNGRSINASGAAVNPFTSFGVLVNNRSEVTIQNGHINGFGYAGIFIASAGNPNTSQKNRVEHVDFDRDLIGVFPVNSSNTLVENCLFSQGSIGIYDIGGVGDRIQKCDFEGQRGIQQLNEGIGVVSTTGANGGTLVEDCLFTLEQSVGLAQQGPNDKFRFCTFLKDPTNHVGGTDEMANSL